MGRAGLCTIANKAWSLDRMLEIAADAGASSVEIWGQPPHVTYPIDEQALANARSRCDQLGLDPVAFGSYYQPGKPLEFNGVAVTIENQIAAAKSVGAKLIRVWPGSVEYETSTPERRDAVYRELRRLADLAGESGIRVVLERHVGSLTHGWVAPQTVLDELGHENIALNYQIPFPATVEEYRESSEKDFRSLLPRSIHAHLQNYVESADGTLSRTLLDRGIIDYSRFGEIAEQTGYSGYCMVEFPAEIRGGMNVADAIAADIEFIDSLFA